MSSEYAHDPRARLVREKYFSLRPKPLERWLWAQRISPAAERVFWLHWQEGMQRGDWCSELPLRRVARECCIDLSTVTKAYQRLARIGCLRRTDPGRDSANPFQQATALTEVRIPSELLAELERHPNRRTQFSQKSEKCVHPRLAPQPPNDAHSAPKALDPFQGLSGRGRLQALAQLTSAMSGPERARFSEAQRGQLAHMRFDLDSKLSAADQGRVVQLLAILATNPTQVASTLAPASASATLPSAPRKLSIFELARLRREIQSASGSASAPELLRQVIWSIEEGPLRRFASTHAIHIALKKIREHAWTRPNRMPPNWVRALNVPAGRETCRQA